MKWPSSDIVLKTEVDTDTNMIHTGEIQALPALDWKKKKWYEYDKIQHQLKYITDEEWRTLENICKQLTSSNIK